MNQLDQLKKMTVVVSDTGEFEEIRKYQPTDGTTNPSLIFAAASKPEYGHLMEEALGWGKKKGQNRAQQKRFALEKIFINFGLEILKIVPGRVSTEVDARLSFDLEGSIQMAREIIALYEANGIDRERILIKFASTWEGIKAAERLEKEKIHCNMTLMFSLGQAIACAESRATLISPFVGRILDWYKKSEGKQYGGKDDPGVKSVTQIFNYYKKMGYKTQIMGASFRTLDEILELAGCDLLTIAPKFLDELQKSEAPVSRKLDPAIAKVLPIEKIEIDEKSFRWSLCENPMASEKLDEGIRNFAKDIQKLEQLIDQKLDI